MWVGTGVAGLEAAEPMIACCVLSVGRMERYEMTCEVECGEARLYIYTVLSPLS